jgi:transposase, IS5 family
MIDWAFLAQRFSAVCRVGPGQPPLPTRLVAGLFILKLMHNLYDEMLCERWAENPYFQYFCGEVVFRHDLPFDRSSLTRWRQRLGEEQIAALLQESLSVAHRTGAIEIKDLERVVVVDTTVQEKAIAHPTDARLTPRAIEKLVELASARASSCARAICGWPSGPPSWWGLEAIRPEPPLACKSGERRGAWRGGVHPPW